MTEPVPVRVTEAVRITRAAEVVETVRVIEYATTSPPGPPALPPGPPARLNTRPDGSGMWLHGHVEPAAPPTETPALPPAPARRRPWWWLW